MYIYGHPSGDKEVEGGGGQQWATVVIVVLTMPVGRSLVSSVIVLVSVM